MSRDVSIALGYRPNADSAPRVLASGFGLLSERIREIAEHHGVPFHEDPDLAELLSHIPLESEVPAELYPAIAEIFAFLWSISHHGGTES